MQTGMIYNAVSNLANSDIFLREDVNLLDKSTVAADYIISQAQSFIDHGDVIRMDRLIHIDEPALSSQIAEKIPEQIGTRFSQLGYHVDVSQVQSGGHSATAVGVPSSSAKKPDFVTSGTYKRERWKLYVNLKITEVETGRVVGAFDYRMPISREINALSKPQAKIMRVE